MNKTTRAFSELIFATFLFSLFGVFTRLISDSLGVFVQLFFRVGLMALIFLIIGLSQKIFKPIQKNSLPLFLFRGVLVVVDFACFYVAVTQLPLGLSLFIFYASNVITSYVFGTLVLKEKMDRQKYIGLALAILGLYVMYGDSLTTVRVLPMLAAFISGVCFGLTTATSKKLTDEYDSTQVNLLAYLVSFVLLIPLIGVFHETMPAIIRSETIVEIIGFAIVGVGAFYLTLDGFKYVEVQRASLIMLTELLFVLIVGFVFFKEIPTIQAICGGILILCALAIPNIKFSKTN